MPEITYQQFADELAHYGSDRMDREEVIKTILNGHRTSQQLCMKFCVRLIRAFSEIEHTDLRNEASVRMAKQFCHLVREGQIDAALPYI
jgi:hypothetical protein